MLVRTGRFPALVAGGTAELEIDVDAFGRMAELIYVAGSVTATCSDGARRSLQLRAPDGVVFAGAITPAGTFTMSGSGNTTLEVSGTFDHGSLGGLVDFSTELPGGISCRARATVFVGSLMFPMSDRWADGSEFPLPPESLPDV